MRRWVARLILLAIAGGCLYHLGQWQIDADTYPLDRTDDDSSTMLALFLLCSGVAFAVVLLFAFVAWLVGEAWPRK